MNIGKQWDGADDESFETVYAVVVRMPEKASHSDRTTMILESLGDVEVAMAFMRELGNHGWSLNAQLDSPDKSATVFYTTDPLNS